MQFSGTQIRSVIVYAVIGLVLLGAIIGGIQLAKNRSQPSGQTAQTSTEQSPQTSSTTSPNDKTKTDNPDSSKKSSNGNQGKVASAGSPSQVPATGDDALVLTAAMVAGAVVASQFYWRSRRALRPLR